MKMISIDDIIEYCDNERAAIHFDRISILWFYIVPLIGMSANFRKDGDSK